MDNRLPHFGMPDIKKEKWEAVNSAKSGGDNNLAR